MTTSNNVEHSKHKQSVETQCFSDRLSGVLTPLEAHELKWTVIRRGRVRAAYEDAIAPIVWQLSKFMKRELGAECGAELEINATGFDDESPDADITVSFPNGKFLHIGVLVSFCDGTPVFAFEGLQTSIGHLSIEPGGDGCAVSYNLRLRHIPGLLGVGADEIVSIDAKRDFLEFLGSELANFLADTRHFNMRSQ